MKFNKKGPKTSENLSIDSDNSGNDSPFGKVQASFDELKGTMEIIGDIPNLVEKHDKPDSDTKREAAENLKRHAEGIEAEADKIDEGLGRAKALRGDAEKVRETAEYLKDEADSDDTK